MSPDIQDTLLQLFEQVRQDSDTIPIVPIDEWQAGSAEWQLLTSFNSMLEQVQQRTLQLMHTEQQLREKEEQYRSIFEATSDALLIRDLEDGHVVEANPAACRMYGYSYEEFIGLAANVITHLDSLRLLPEGLQIVRAGHQLQFQGLGLRKDGTAIHVETRGTPFTYKGKLHVLGVSRDITERVQAQQLLEQRVEERTRELSTLLEVSHNVASTIELKPLLDLILTQLKAVVDYTGSSLAILEHDDLVLVGTRGPESEEHLIQRRFPLKHMGLIWEMLCRREPVIIDNVRDDTPLAQAYRESAGELLQTTFRYIHSWIAVPLMLKERVIGMLSASHSESNYYEPRHATLALAIANQAAIAIENARLYEQAQELAAIEERQRLARELHDSVSQALYGISLGVHTARLQVDHNPGELAESLDYVLELAEAALTEMRALIFELRPESLEAEGLVTALTKQAAALHARHGINVELDLCDELDLTLKVKRELYRVAQEALHNTVKHAEASRADLRLHLVDGKVSLEVRDNGKGFEATGSFPGHLGLHSMRERVRSLGWGASN
jgi:PAS domain S-box-containing protein